MSKRIYSLGWSAVENAQNYRVFRSLTEVGNKQELVLTSQTSLALNQYITGSSDYYYFIKAQATGYQDSDYSAPLRWKTFSISRSVDAGVIETTDDYFAGEGFGYNTGFVAPEGKIFNRAVCLLTIGGIQHPEYISFLTGDKAFNIDIPAEAVTGDIVYSAVVQDEQAQLTAPTIAMNADGKTLEITDVTDATSYDVYVDGALKTNVQRVTKHKVTFTRKQQGMNGRWQYSLTGGADWVGITQSNTPIIVENVSQIKFRTKSFAAGHPYETYMTWNNPTGRIDCTTGDWVVSDNITPTGDMTVIYYGDNNPV